jgi:two-component system, chemotaxis family, protein-glutamate methylesterase/glutaminase
MLSRDIIVIGGSAGTIAALQRIFADLPPDLPATVFVVVHIGQQNSYLANALDRCGSLRVVNAEDGMPVERGSIYLAPPDHHLLLLEDTIRLGHGPRENMCRPAVDPLFRSAAVAYGPRVIGAVLTGTLNDGAAGIAAVKQCGGVTVVQNPSDAQAASMPLGALRATDVDYRAPAAELGRLLDRLAREEAGPPMPIPPELGLEVDIALGRAVDTPILRKIGDPVALTCPTCGGVLSEVRQNPPLRYRCQVGHAFTAEILEQEQLDPVDDALRMALRIIEERVTLADRMAEDAHAAGRHKSATLFEERSKELRSYTKTIRQAVLHFKE